MRKPTIVSIVAFSIAIFGCISLFLWVQTALQTVRSRSCGDNLRQLGVALRGYEYTYKQFPQPVSNGHSWRIGLMPFVISNPLYGNYRYQEAWDSDWNSTLHARPLESKDGGLLVSGVPGTYQCRRYVNRDCDTSFLLFVGTNAFGKPDGYRKLAEVVDGERFTLIAGETINKPIHWLDPTDFEVATMSLKINDATKLSISSHHAFGPLVLFLDGSVFRVSPSIPSETLLALITINGGEDVNPSDLIHRGLLAPP